MLIRVHGFVMLEGLNDGCRYRVKKVYKLFRAHTVYEFSRPRGRKTITSHRAENVDPWVTGENDRDLNKIVVEEGADGFHRECGPAS
jgi:hypothetical protein